MADNLMADDRFDIVSVRTTARAHLGFMDPSGRGERPFGSVGVSLDRPFTHVKLSCADELDVEGADPARARSYIEKLSAFFGASANVRVEIVEAIPAHAGLGSGTQLAIAIGTAYTRLFGIETSAREIAMVLGRGKRSGIGIGAFQTGGLLFDAGPNDKGSIAPILSRIAFPRKWRIVLIFDHNQDSIYGEKELLAFEELGAVPQDIVAEMCRRTVLGLLPAAVEEDFDLFSDSFGYLQQVMGQYFGPAQGGSYTSKRVGEVLSWARAQGYTGVGQSSWGPTGLVFLDDEEKGLNFIAEARKKWSEIEGLKFELAAGLNQGAVVETIAESTDGVGGRVGQPA